MSKNKLYPIVYLEDFSDCFASALKVLNGYDCDLFYVIDKLLSGVVFSEIFKRANPRYLNMGSHQIIECIYYEDSFDWERTQRKEEEKNIDDYQLWWLGKLLTIFQWLYKIDFRDWVKYFSSKEIYQMFYPLHEASFENAADKLYENYKYRKKNNMYKD